MNFDQALVHVLKHEGGYVNHPSDPGGETNYGITVAVARGNGYAGTMRDIPMSVVASIYRRGYWDAVRADQLPEGVRFHVFDAAVNSGVRRAAMWLQEAVGAHQDGVIGPKTIAAAHAFSDAQTVARYSSVRLRFLSGLNTFQTFGRGWIRRVADNLMISG